MSRTSNAQQHTKTHEYTQHTHTHIHIHSLPCPAFLNRRSAKKLLIESISCPCCRKRRREHEKTTKKAVAHSSSSSSSPSHHTRMSLSYLHGTLAFGRAVLGEDKGAESSTAEPLEHGPLLRQILAKYESAASHLTDDSLGESSKHTHTQRTTHTERTTHTHRERERERERERKRESERERESNTYTTLTQTLKLSCCYFFTLPPPSPSSLACSRLPRNAAGSHFLAGQRSARAACSMYFFS